MEEKKSEKTKKTKAKKQSKEKKPIIERANGRI